MLCLDYIVNALTPPLCHLNLRALLEVVIQFYRALLTKLCSFQIHCSTLSPNGAILISVLRLQQTGAPTLSWRIAPKELSDKYITSSETRGYSQCFRFKQLQLLRVHHLSGKVSVWFGIMHTLLQSTEAVMIEKDGSHSLRNICCDIEIGISFNVEIYVFSHQPQHICLFAWNSILFDILICYCFKSFCFSVQHLSTNHFMILEGSSVRVFQECPDHSSNDKGCSCLYLYNITICICFKSFYFSERCVGFFTK